jgi:putative DNA primase/helicase
MSAEPPPGAAAPPMSETDKLRDKELSLWVENELEGEDERLAIQQAEQQQERDAPTGVETIALAQIQAKPIVPLWPGALYAGKVTVLAGIPGDGKSLASVDVASRISAGAAWPVGAGRFKKGRTLLLSVEDDAADTIRPRVDVAGGDPDLIEYIRGVFRIDENGRRVLDTVSLIEDLPNIETKLIGLGVVFFIVDPLTSFAGNDTNKTADMRRLLDSLSQTAARTAVAILVIGHLNKRSDARRAMQLVAGSHVITAAVRVALVSARDPNDKERRLMLPIKLNIARDEGGFAFRINVRAHQVCGDTPRCDWESSRVLDLSADEALIDSTPRAQAAVEKANEVQDWLRDLLRAEPVPASSMWRQAKDKGYGEHRVRGALKAVGAVAEVLGYQGKWHYRLPVSAGNGIHVEV